MGSVHNAVCAQEANLQRRPSVPASTIRRVPRSRTWIAAASIVIVILALAGGAVSCDSEQTGSPEARENEATREAAGNTETSESAPSSKDDSLEPSGDRPPAAPASVPGVVAMAADQVHDAFEAGTEPDAVALTAVSSRRPSEITPEALRALLRLARDLEAPPPADAYLELGASLLEADRFALAREVLIAGEREHPSEKRFASRIERALDADPNFVQSMRTLAPDEDVDAIKYLGGGSTIVLRFIKDKKTFAAFKPLQSRQQTDPRAEIAAWRICPLIRCGFVIPYTEPVRLEKRAFDGLYARLSHPKQIAYRENFDDLEYVREPDPDGGDDIHWVTGALKVWVPDFTLFPVEITRIWRPWLSLEQDESVLEGAAVDSLEIVEENHPSGEMLARKLRRHMGDMSRRELARQISNMIAYDFLINNWDRFSGAPAYYGVNCQFANRRIVSIDNGASFTRTPSPKVEKQLRRVQRFSLQLVSAVRALDRERTMKRLFPDPTDYDRVRFATFWAQRAAFLEYVDELIETHGEEAVLAFE